MAWPWTTGQGRDEIGFGLAPWREEGDGLTKTKSAELVLVKTKTAEKKMVVEHPSGRVRGHIKCLLELATLPHLPRGLNELNKSTSCSALTLPTENVKLLS